MGARVLEIPLPEPLNPLGFGRVFVLLLIFFYCGFFHFVGLGFYNLAVGSALRMSHF